MTTKVGAFTAKTALRFKYKGDINADFVRTKFHKDDKPYKDVLTYKRWVALGFKAKPKQRGTKLLRKGKDGEVTQRGPKVWCKHQVVQIS